MPRLTRGTSAGRKAIDYHPAQYCGYCLSQRLCREDAMSDLIERKLHHVFDVLDIEGSGALTADSILNAAERYTRFRGVTPGSDRAERLYESIREYWSAMAGLDTDGDGKVSRQEFTTGLVAVASDPGMYEKSIETTADTFFDLADMDGNGRLDRDEYVDLYSVGVGIGRSDTIRAFARMDVHAKGYLTREEWRGAVAEFYQSTDPDAPGNWLWGPY
ncbi:EF-hand domain-containing protein [Streptomyces sp. NPDC059564]|uniref:EF-hand domain-containing protein n=1 Tax=Streptomyces sp. NPDC059564 TaxID=3346865 RepID=UPI0036CA9391